jgi:hypothetical protein
MATYDEVRGQEPLWPERCRHCGLPVEVDYYGIWRVALAGELAHSAFCVGAMLHEPGRGWA